MITKKFLSTISILMIIFIANPNSVTSSPDYSIMDEEDDVMKITWNEDGSGNYEIVSDQPDYDIIGLTYSLVQNGDALISLSVKGTIQSINSYYWINIIDEINNFQIIVWFGLGWASATVEQMTGYEYVNGSKPGVGNALYEISGNNLSLTLSKYVIFGPNNTLISYPSKSSNTWKWHVNSWNGDSIGTNSGTWYIDYTPDSDNKYTDILNPPTTGIEFLYISFSLIVITVIRLRKINQKL